MRYLKETALGRKVEVKFGGTQRDRYGVVLGHVFVSGSTPIWLQDGLVASGFAEAYPQPEITPAPLTCWRRRRRRARVIEAIGGLPISNFLRQTIRG